MRVSGGVGARGGRCRGRGRVGVLLVEGGGLEGLGMEWKGVVVVRGQVLGRWVPGRLVRLLRGRRWRRKGIVRVFVG